MTNDSDQQDPAQFSFESDARYRALFEADPCNFGLIDDEFRIVDLNAKGLQLLEADSLDQLRGSQITDFIAPEHVERYMQDSSAAFNSGGTVVRSLEIVGLQGARHWIEWRSISLPAGSDRSRVIQVLSVIRDITKNKRHLEMLTQSEREYRCFFENALDAIIIFRPEDEVVLKANNRACTMYGFSQEDFIGMSLTNISQDVARGKDYIQQTLHSGALSSFETKQFRRDGTVIPLDVSASVIEYRGERAIHSINRDITLRLQAKARLIDAERREVLAQLAGGIAHEFNSTLLAAGIHLQEPSLIDNPATAKAAMLIQQAQTLSASLLELYAAPDSTSLPNLPLGDWLPTFIANSADSMPRGILIKLSQIRNVAPVRIDPISLEHVLRILLGNASDAVRGEGTIEVSAARSDDGAFVEIRVIDTGPGIPEKDRSRVFEPFFTTRNRARRSGLGLAIATRLIEQANGRLFYECNEPRGSIFVVQLPVAPGVDE